MATIEIIELTTTIGGMRLTAMFYGGDPKAFVESVLRATSVEIAGKMLTRAKAIEVERPDAAAVLRECATDLMIQPNKDSGAK